MNTDPTRPERPTPADEPAVIGAGLRPVEDRLRRALDAEARSIIPGERLGAILTEAHAPQRGATGTTGGHHRWYLPAAAAAATVLIAGTVWAVNRPPSQTPPVAATSSDVGSTSATTGATSSGPSSVPTQTATGPTSPATSVPPRSVLEAVPVYYLGPVVAGSDQLRLFREFVPGSVTAPATPEGEALAALRLAMGDAPAGSAYVPAWSGVTPLDVQLGGDAITVRLSKGTSSPAALATQQLVWTVQAALGKTLPVRFALADGGVDVAPGHPVSTTYTRPSGAMAVLDEVAPIWVDEPARADTVETGSPLKVKGVASTFEANVEWQLLRDGQVVDRGFTTASEAAPARGSYAFTTTKPLTAGAYVLRVFASSAKDGSPVAEQTVPLTAR